MFSPPRVHRLPRVVAVLVMVVVPLLSGCLRYTESLTIHPDDTVSGIIVMAARQPDPVSADEAPPPPSEAALPEPTSDSEDIVVTSFQHDQESGYKVTFARATFDEVAAFAPLGKDGGALLITRYGDQLTIMMTIDLTYPLSGQGQAYVAEHADTTVSLQVPGEVTETNGEVSGDRIRWDLKPFTVNTVSATIISPAEAAVTPAGTRSIDPARAAMLGAGAIAIVALVWFILRRHLARPAPAHLGPVAAARHEPQRRSGTHRPSLRPHTAATAARPGPLGEPDPVVRSAEQTSRVRPVQQIDGGGWPPPRPRWKEHR